jgi:selenide,water dikinase
VSSSPFVVLNGEQALVSTTELIPAVIDPLDDLGAVAAAHALVGIYAAGATPVLAVPFAICPTWMGDLDLAVLWPAMAEVLASAGAEVAAGRSTRGPDLLVGMSVSGVVHPERVLPVDDARVGDVLVVSKPLGTGAVLAAGEPNEVEGVVAGMTLTNRIAGERLVELGDDVHAAVGVGALGLLGHSHELAARAGVHIVLDASLVPCYRGAKRLASTDGSDPAAAVAALAAAPETSGGLLAAVHPAAVDELVEAGFRPVGSVVEPVVDDEGYLEEPLVTLG